MRTLLLTIVICSFIEITGVSSSRAQTTFFQRYIVEFKDKNNSPFSVDRPLEFLSQRSIDRRTRQQIPITENDLPITPSYIQQVQQKGVTLLNRSKWLNSISISTTDSFALVAITQLPFVKDVFPVAPALIPRGGSSISKFQQEETLTNAPTDFGQSSWQIEMLNGESLHDQNFRGQGMVIAFLDNGFYHANQLAVFDSVFQQGRVLGYHNYVDEDTDVFNHDAGWHGCETFSTIASNIPGTMVGTAPLASFYLYHTEDDFSEYPIEEHNWAAGAEAADSVGADVITSSLGYFLFDDSIFNITYQELDGNTTMVTRAADFAAKKGMIVCNAAGNEGLSPWFYIIAPADADSILTVGGVDSSGTITAFSSHGPASDGDIKPDVVGRAIGCAIVNPGDGTIARGSGTSFATPIMAGLMTCLWQAHPDKNNMAIIHAVQQSASLFHDPDDSMGYGIPDFKIADSILTASTDTTSGQSIVSLLPNPCSSFMNGLIHAGSADNIQGSIYNENGQLMENFKIALHAGLNAVSIPVAKLGAGFYTMRIKTQSGQSVKSFVKINH